MKPNRLFIDDNDIIHKEANIIGHDYKNEIILLDI